MRFEPRHAFLASRRLGRPPQQGGNGALPLEVAFLAGQIDRAILIAAADAAKRERICAVRVLIVSGQISPSSYYRQLAAHLGLAFVRDWPEIAPLADPAEAHRIARVKLVGRACWLAAPEGDALRTLLREGPARTGSTAITTPAHLAALIHYRSQDAITGLATNALPSAAPRLSAKGAADVRVGIVATVAIIIGIFGIVSAPRPLGDCLGLLFFAGIVLRLIVGASGFADGVNVPSEALLDANLPTYTILVPLSREAEIVPDLLAALNALDYPREKLQVLILIEPEDLSTREALAASSLPPWLHVVFGPIARGLRTKPRALNIGLTLARGEFLTVFDAEDRPEPDQLRRAAAVFAKESRIACLQARLSIDNGADSILARLFAIEYAVLFDLLNIGTAGLDLPMALGGTSNHFRTSVLRDVGGWDAWNVTEDADLGLRLARFGYDVHCLASTTVEAAPDNICVWMKQRRRWTKGWMQTLLVVTRDAPNVLRSLGWRRSSALVLLFVNLVVGPLLLPLFCGLVAYDLAVFGLPQPRNVVGLVEATLAASVFLFGIGSVLGLGYAGLKARGLMRFLPSLPLLLPYQLMISAAAWMGLFDLVVAPYHWHKTRHRPATRNRIQA